VVGLIGELPHEICIWKHFSAVTKEFKFKFFVKGNFSRNKIYLKIEFKYSKNRHNVEITSL